MKKIITFLLALMLVLSLAGCAKKDKEPVREPETVKETEPIKEEETVSAEAPALDEDGRYSSKEDVSAYLYIYEHLPSNYITKNKARKLGWVAEEGNLWDVTDHMSIGGDVFKNLEGNLPEDDDRTYYECDIDYKGGKRNAKRIVYSNDGLIYYTEDHYTTFELLYGEE